MLESMAAAQVQLLGRMARMTIPFDLLPFAAAAGSVIDALERIVTFPVEIFHGYSSLLRWAADAAQSLFEKYGYWVVFFGTLSENTLLVGLIVPGALVVILAGLAAHDGTISWPEAVVLGIAGTIIGDTISYFMGRYGWSRFSHWKILRDLNEKAREPILRRGVLFVLVYHFAGYTRVIGPTTAGLLRMPYRTWAPADYGGAVLWVCAYFGVGYGLGVAGLTLDSTDRYFRYVEWGLLIVLSAWAYFLIQAHARSITDRLRIPSDTTEKPRDAESAAVD